MVSKEQNERLTHVGPGTPIGELLPSQTAEIDRTHLRGSTDHDK